MNQWYQHGEQPSSFYSEVTTRRPRRKLPGKAESARIFIPGLINYPQCTLDIYHAPNNAIIRGETVKGCSSVDQLNCELRAGNIPNVRGDFKIISQLVILLVIIDHRSIFLVQALFSLVNQSRFVVRNTLLNSYNKQNHYLLLDEYTDSKLSQMKEDKLYHV